MRTGRENIHFYAKMHFFLLFLKKSYKNWSFLYRKCHKKCQKLLKSVLWTKLVVLYSVNYFSCIIFGIFHFRGILHSEKDFIFYLKSLQNIFETSFLRISIEHHAQWCIFYLRNSKNQSKNMSVWELTARYETGL